MGLITVPDILLITMPLGFPGGTDGKESACNAGDPGLIPRLGKSPGEGNGNPLQYSCLENAMDREAWRATVHGLAELDVTEQLTHTHTHSISFIHLLMDIKVASLS